MNSDERLARAYLTTVDSLDDNCLRQLAARHGVLGAAELVAHAGTRPVDWELTACRLLDRARRHDSRFLTPDDDEWPSTVGRDSAGFGLWVTGRGQLGPLLRQAVVVLGSVRPTPYAARVAATLAQDLTAAGRTIVTSGAPGVPGAVLRGTLAADRPMVAVPAGGALTPRPVLHSRLFRRVTYRGLIVHRTADQPADRNARFARQSRLLAAAASAVVLIEPEHGTLASAVAEQATRIGRPVFAVPGPVLTRTADNPAPAEYAHQLIRDHTARLVRGADDILTDLADPGALAGASGSR